MSSTVLINAATLFLFGALLCLLLFAVGGKHRFGNWAQAAAAAGFLALTGALLLRWRESYRLLGGEGHIPLTNFYESLLFFAWALLLVHFLLQLRFRLPLLGTMAIPSALLALLAAQWSADAAIRPLVPALKSNWLTFHVATCFLGYAAFAAGAAAAMLLVARKSQASKMEKGLLPGPELLEEIHLQAVTVGFLLLTLGILTGSAWAHGAWGSYWSWDPKETWSLIVWLIYAAWLHARLSRGWSGKRLAWLSLLGFAATLFCWLGVNLLLPGLHSYGGM
ncbi:MAG: c-type cytochrome biogenesis protein CcsB [Deltaproteobacteria bacterium]|nr:c-type cytochrome biogenesis protein CcsB [Deltaproteobacteria bacterium]